MVKFRNTVTGLESNNIYPLAEIASSLYKSVTAAIKKHGINISDNEKLANILDTANELINDLVDVEGDVLWDGSSNRNSLMILNNYENAVNGITGMNRDTKRMITGACLSLLGFALFAASVTVAVMTFGAATPLSVAAAAVSTELMVAGAVTMGVTAVAGLSLGVANGIFANRDRKGPLACRAEDFGDKVKSITNR